MESKISVEIGVASSTLWDRFWEDESDARYFVKIIENALNPLGNWWVGSKQEEQTADNYIKACRNYGANFNLKFQRDGWFWSKFNSYLVVAQQNMPRTIKEIWYCYTDPSDPKTQQKPVAYLYIHIREREGYKKIEQLLPGILTEFGRWLLGKAPSHYSFKLDASDLEKECKYDAPTHLTFRFFYTKNGEVKKILNAKQEVTAIFCR